MWYVTTNTGHWLVTRNYCESRFLREISVVPLVASFRLSEPESHIRLYRTAVCIYTMKEL